MTKIVLGKGIDDIARNPNKTDAWDAQFDALKEKLNQLREEYTYTGPGPQRDNVASRYHTQLLALMKHARVDELRMYVKIDHDIKQQS